MFHADGQIDIKNSANAPINSTNCAVLKVNMTIFIEHKVQSVKWTQFKAYMKLQSSWPS
jgi:hypothetical protein